MLGEARKKRTSLAFRALITLDRAVYTYFFLPCRRPPLKTNMAVPVVVIRHGIVGADVRTAALLPLQGGLDHQSRNADHVLQLPAARIVELPGQDVAAPMLDRLLGLGQRRRRRGGRRRSATSDSSRRCECRPGSTARRSNRPAGSRSAGRRSRPSGPGPRATPLRPHWAP